MNANLNKVVVALGLMALAGGALAQATASGIAASARIVTPIAISAATFTVTGEPNYSYAVTLPAGQVTLTSGSTVMFVSGFASDRSGGGNLGSGGSQSRTVGATATVNARTALWMCSPASGA